MRPESVVRLGMASVGIVGATLLLIGSDVVPAIVSLAVGAAAGFLLARLAVRADVALLRHKGWVAIGALALLVALVVAPPWLRGVFSMSCYVTLICLAAGGVIR